MVYTLAVYTLAVTMSPHEMSLSCFRIMLIVDSFKTPPPPAVFITHSRTAKPCVNKVYPPFLAAIQIPQIGVQWSKRKEKRNAIKFSTSPGYNWWMFSPQHSAQCSNYNSHLNCTENRSSSAENWSKGDTTIPAQGNHRAKHDSLDTVMYPSIHPSVMVSIFPFFLWE